MSGTRSRVCGLLLATLCSAPLSGATVAGHTTGQFQVGESGAATYTIPVTALPGTSGLEPQIAFSYNSQGNNSLLGVGWSLSGLSVISRCPATLAQDEVIDPVDFDENDRFCLDGERLTAIGGVYGANSAEYRTEQDTFRRVISHNQAGMGPESFTVQTKGGLIFKYGGTEDSRIQAQGKTSVLFWAVSRIADTKGNYLTITYVENNGEYRPSRIDYTGNDLAGLVPYSSVRFTYEARPDVTPQYVAGSQLTVTQRLTSVRAYEGEQLYREYRLSYQVSEASGRSRLVSITECGSNGDCFAPTAFVWRAWASGDFNFNGSGSGNWPGHGGAPSNNFLGDFNGDGKTDIMGYTFTQGLWHVVLSNGTSFGGGGGFWNGHAGGPTNNFLGDFNGDGRTDIMGYSSSPGLWNVNLSSGTGFNAPGGGAWSGHAGGSSNNFLGDFNGDGRTDIMGFSSSAGLFNVNLSSGTGFNAPGGGVWNGHAGGPGNNFLGDFNGDGRTDIVGYTGSPGLWHVKLSSGTGFNAPGGGMWNGHSGGSSNNFLGDFNGDGKTDIMGYTGSQGRWHVSLSSGSNFNAPGSGHWSGHAGGPGNNILGDFNGDGMTDIAGHVKDNKWSVCLSVGTNFACRDWTGNSGGTSNNFLGDFNGDGKTDTMRSTSTFGLWQVALSGGPSPDMLVAITDGHGFSTTVEYASLGNSQVYTKGGEASYPEQDFQGPLYVVASHASSNGIGGTNQMSYKYEAAKVSLVGRGFRGFGRTTVTDAITGIKVTIFYERDHRCVGAKIRRAEQRQSDGTLISEVDNTIDWKYNAPGVYFSFIRASTAKSYELDGSLVSAVVTTTDFDNHGNVVTLSIDYGGGLTEATTHVYGNDLDNWLLGRLTSRAVTKAAEGQPTQTRTSTFTYAPGTILLTSELVEPEFPSLRLEKTFQHDTFGNIVLSTTSGPSITSRTHTTVTDQRGRHVISSINALGHMEATSYTLGSLTSLTGPNLLETRWTYDGFGRQTQELRADGTETLTAYIRCSGNCPERAVYSVRSDTLGAPSTTTYYDLLDRVVRQETQGFNGTPVLVDIKYNARGLRKWVSEPYFAGGSPLWTEYNFDILGRVTQETAPGSRITTTEYDGLTTTVTNPLQQRNVRVVDSRGQLISSTDHFLGAVNYEYDAFGNMVRMTDPLGHRTTVTYDIRGNRTTINDPDTGTATFVYNALGELILQTNSNHNTIALTYDVLGRLTERADPEGSSVWVYDAPGKGVGKLSQVSRGDYSEEYFYDAMGRAEQTRVTIAGTSYSLTTSYDGFGRPDRLIYPTGFGVRTLYNAQGYAMALRRESDNYLLWQVGNINARGQVEQATLGNGLVTTREFNLETGRVERIRTTGGAQDLSFTYDVLGNLQARRDNLRGLSEAFTYDMLNRLSSSQVAGRAAVTVSYDALGNITSKSDVGTYTYGENGAGPHAVTSIIGARGGTYTYDVSGNLSHRQPNLSPPTTIAYTSFNKPKEIVEGVTALSFAYGPEYDRYRQVVTTPNGVTTKLYIGGLFELETSASSVRNIHHIRAGGEVFASYIEEVSGGATQRTTRYLHRDHLGSVQTISNGIGTVVDVLSFDSWGLRRNAQDWSPATNSIFSTTDRGFTGHEHLDEVSLIHMNGRVYDPIIGRFLSVDPFMQLPEFSQSLNRYSYVLNNPLSLTDPSGYFFKGLFRFAARAVGSVFNFVQQNVIARTVISVGVGYLTAGFGLSTFFEGLGSAFKAIGSLNLSLPQAIVSGAGFGFGSAFSGTLLSGGDLKAALTAGVRSAFITGLESTALFGVNRYLTEPEILRLHQSLKQKTFALVERFKSQVPSMIARGAIRGIASEAKGGNFLDSFKNSIVADAISVGRDTVVEVGSKGCLSSEPCADLFRLTALPGERSLVGFQTQGNSGWFVENILGDKGILRFTNYIPGVNSAAAFHDRFVDFLGVSADKNFAEFLMLNPGTIAPVFALNYMALGVGMADRPEDTNFVRLRSF